MVDSKGLLDSVLKMRSAGKQRKFSESIELIINFKGINFKKQENQIDVRVVLPHSTGKASGKVLIFAKDKEFISDMQGKTARIIQESEISSLDKKEIAAIANEYDILLAEGPVMLTVGKFMGQVLAPRGKMPRPIQANASSVQSMLSTWKADTKISNKKGKFMPTVQLLVGSEKMPDSQLIENILAAYESVLNSLPNKKYNIKSVIIKKTMGKPVRVEALL